MIYGKTYVDAPSVTDPKLQRYAYDAAREELETYSILNGREILPGPPELVIMPIGRQGYTIPTLVWPVAVWP